MRLAGVVLAPNIVAPFSRALLRTPALAVAVAAGVPVAVVVVRQGTDLALAPMLGALVGGASLAFAVDDASAGTVAAVPVPLGMRRAIRAALIAAVAVGAWFGSLAVADADGYVVGPPRGLLAPTIATAGTALALAAGLDRRDEPAAAAAGSFGALLAVATSATLAMRWPWFPTPLPGASTRAWWTIALVAWLATAWYCRDPAGRLPGFAGLRPERLEGRSSSAEPLPDVRPGDAATPPGHAMP